MSDIKTVTAAIVHDLAGMVTNLQAFSGILEASPDHKSRDQFLEVLAKEARASVQAVKDLQVVAEIESSDPGAADARLTLAEFVRAAADSAGAEELLPANATREVMIPQLMVTLLARTLELARVGPAWPLEVETEGPSPILRIDLSGCGYEGDLAADVPRGRKELRPAALLMLAAQQTGGAAEFLPEGILVLSLPPVPR